MRSKPTFIIIFMTVLSLALSACASSTTVPTNTPTTPSNTPVAPTNTAALPSTGYGNGYGTAAPAATATETPTANQQVQTTMPTQAPTSTSENAMVTPSNSQVNKVQVTETEFKIDMPKSLPAGQTEFEIKNQGTVQHSFEIENEAQGFQAELEHNLNPGETATLTVNLQPGTYHVYCPVDGHEDLGMSLDITVTGG